MAGRLNRRIIAARAQSAVVQPTAGNTPSAAPSATLRAIFSGVTPCLSRSRIGRTSHRLKYLSSTIRPVHLRIRLQRSDGARVVMDDLPSFRKPLPHQSEHSSEVVRFPLQMPAPQRERTVRSQKTKLQIRKIKLSHRGAVRIIFLVTRQDAVPAARHAAAAREGQFWRMPIAHQKRINIAAIPCRLLRVEHRADGLPVGVASLRRSSYQAPLPDEG